MGARADEEWICTDETWRAKESSAWTPSLPADVVAAQLAEVLDGRALDLGWDAPGFDAGGWAAARVLVDHGFAAVGDGRPPSEPYGAILPSPLPPRTERILPAVVIQVARTGVPTAVDTPSDSGGTDDLGAEIGAALSATVGLTPPEPSSVPDRSVDAASERTRVQPAELSAELSGPAIVVADFGGVVAGHPRLRFAAAGDVVVSGAFHEVAAPEALGHAATFRYTAREGQNTFAREDPCGGRFLVLSITGSGSIRFAGIEFVERLRPRPAGPSFEASDPGLTRVYRVGLRTVDLNAQDAYLDCPSREQRAWTGDSVVHQSVDLIANPDWSLPTWNPQLLDQPRADGLLPMIGAGDFAMPDQVSIPDWALHWIRSVYNLYRYTGDRELVASMLPAAESTLRWFTDFLGCDGLLREVTGWVLIDWAPVPVSGASASLNALWGRALLDFAEIAAWLGDTNRAEWARGHHRRLRGAFEAFWDERRGAYREHIVDGALQPVVTEHANASAACGGLVPAERRPLLRDLLLDRSRMFSEATFLSGTSPEEPRRDPERWVVGAQPFFRYVVHDALALLGAADRIAGLCRDWLMLLEIGPSAWREVWEGGSYAHGWCSTPSRDLVVYTLGVTPAEPGYAAIRVAPRLGDLEWARGVVPTPQGSVTVHAHGDAVEVSSPVPVEVIARSGAVVRYRAGTIHARI